MLLQRLVSTLYPFAVVAIVVAHGGQALAQSATIEGTITDSGDGTPIANATVAVSYPGGIQHELLATATSNNVGQYSVSVPMASGASRDLVVEAAGVEHAPARHGHSLPMPCYFSCGWGGHFSVDEGTTVTGIDIALNAGGRVSGTITDAETGDPLTDAIATLIPPNPDDYSPQEYSPEFAGITQPDGSFTTSLAVAPGTHYLRAGGNGSNHVSQAWGGYPCELDVCPIINSDPITITAGSIEGGFDFALEPGATLSGELFPDDILKQIYLFNGAGRQLTIHSIDWDDLPGSEWSIDGLAGGSYFAQLGPLVDFSGTTDHIRVLHNGLLCPWSGCNRARGTALTVPTGASLSSPPVTLDVGGQIEGTIIDGSTGLPPAGVPAGMALGQYDIIDADGAVVGGGAIRAVDGEILMEPLAAVPAGEYFVRTFNQWRGDGIGYSSLLSSDAIDGYMDAVFPDIPCTGIDCDLASAEAVTVTAGEVASIVIEIETGSSISGRVIDQASGAPIEYAIVRVLDSAGDTVARTLTDADGDYRMGAFPSGNYYVRTSMSGHLGPGHFGVRNAYFDKLHGASGDCSESLCDPATGTAITLDGSADVDLGDLEVSNGPVISGQIINTATGLPITRGQVDVYTLAGAFVGSYKLDNGAASYQTPALSPGHYVLVPNVSPVFGSVSTGGTVSSQRGETVPPGGFSVTMGEVDLEADLQVVDQAIDRLFIDRFSGAE
ncbi:carboxypeptidase regulatory-like domain-containing protein [Wenzhouxiangella sp. EGI_FJ10409]|uniref:carboxypeptidase regulatory-like domain-containing protein n=1 Tax=Wenzhouxiangella sp. EGI_FJ10409 TaxID=3243767 RepID=UPI0035DEC397